MELRAPQAATSTPTVSRLRLTGPPEAELSGLPAPLTRLVGREREKAAVTGLLLRPEVRLVTLTGPGGVGKTRLAIDVATTLEREFMRVACFVSLAPVRSPVLVLPAIGQALGIRDDGRRPLAERLRQRLRAEPLLLVLDNFEHVDAAAPQLAALLAACPRLQALVTSRSRLHLAGEREFVVPPLRLPDPAVRVPPAELAQTEAVALFLDRARELRPEFVFDERNAATVADICRRLDGLPLAIELAAAWVKVVSAEALLARLVNRLQVLTGGPHDLPDRLRTMRDAIAWSYDLLDSAEQTLFRRLAVFADGFTLDAAESTMTAAAEGNATLDLVASLTDKSLLRRADQVNGESRFSVLETIREYALEQLAGAGEETEARLAHAAWCIAFAERAEPELTGSARTDWLDRQDTELPNMREALTWLAATDRLDDARRLAGALARFWEMHGYWAEGRQWLETLVQRAAADEQAAVLQARALGGLGSLAVRMRDFTRALDAYEQSLALSRATGDRRGIANALDNLGYLTDNQGDRDRAEAFLAESVSLYREIGDKRGLAKTLDTLGLIAMLHDDHTRATELLGESLAQSRAADDRWLMAITLANLGVLENHLRHYAVARGHFEESLALSRAIGGNWLIPLDLAYLGLIAQVQADHRRASELFCESLALCRDRAPQLPASRCLEGLAAVAAKRGELERAARLFGAAAAMRDAIRGPMLAADRAIYEPIVADVRRRCGAVTFDAAWAAGQFLSADAAIDEALAPVTAAPGVTSVVSLSPRELDVLRLMAAGQSDREIASSLFISHRTVHHHVAHIFTKLGAHSRTEAATLAVAASLLPSGDTPPS